MTNRTIVAASVVMALGLAGCGQDQAATAAQDERQIEATGQQEVQETQRLDDLGTTELETDSPPSRVEEGIERLDEAGELNNN
jgi:NAD-dependent DNA ligase